MDILDILRPSTDMLVTYITKKVTAQLVVTVGTNDIVIATHHGEGYSSISYKSNVYAEDIFYGEAADDRDSVLETVSDSLVTISADILDD